MLAWFITNVERMEPESAVDAICDGSGDKGIDALEADDDLSEITLYQSKRMTSPSKGQGDCDLKDLVAAAEYFHSTTTVEGLLASKPNPELIRLLTRNGIREKVASGATGVVALWSR